MILIVFCKLFSLGLTYFIGDFFYDAAGIADCDDVCGNILYYNRPCADYRIVSDGYARQDGHVRSQPYVFADFYRLVVKHAF